MLSLSEIRARFDLLPEDQRQTIEEMAKSNRVLDAIKETRRVLDFSIPDADYVVNVILLKKN